MTITIAEKGADVIREDAERGFVGARDGFYLASVSSSGWPYVQFRVKRQHLSTGNVAGDESGGAVLHGPPRSRADRGCRDDPDAAADGAVPGYRAIIEQAVLVTVAAVDWNCPQRITPRCSEPELTAFGRP